MYRAKYYFHDIIGESDAIKVTKEIARRAAKSSSPILVYGETGTGKEILVSSVHNESERRDKPFVTCNCAAIPEGIAESTLFGTVDGAFTGAVKKKGLFELAHNGTLYLDEINSMPISLQGKLLRSIEEGYITRVGDMERVKVSVRIIASINETYEEVLKGNKLRKDLFFRLNVNNIEIPNLKNRISDVEILTKYFIDINNKKMQCNVQCISDEALGKLIEHSWPGNIRELKNVIERAFIESNTGVIELSHIKIDNFNYENCKIGLKEKLIEYEISVISEALMINRYNITKTAEYLKIPRQTLQYKLKIYKIEMNK